MNRGMSCRYLLGCGSYALLDYESSYRIRNKVKYAGYVLRLLRRLQNDGVNIADLNIRMIPDAYSIEDDVKKSKKHKEND